MRKSVSDAENVSELVIKANHICTDGLGMAYLARDILEFLETVTEIAIEDLG